MKSGVLCSGSIIYDTLVHPVEETRWGTTSLVETIEPHLGGNGANTSIALAALGTPVRLLGAVGRGAEGTFALDILRRAGVDLARVSPVDAPMAATIVLVNAAGDRKFLHRVGSSARAFTAPIEFPPGVVDGMAHYHLASIFLLPQLRARASETLQRARAAGLTTSLDTNWDCEGRWMETLEPCLPHLDIIFINEDEALMTTGSSDPREGASRLLERGARMAVMKLGSRGCAVYARAFEASCPAFDVKVKDTTGAGDCFVGGFLAAHLRGASPRDAGVFGNAVGALAVERVGGALGTLPYEDVRRWITQAKTRA